VVIFTTSTLQQDIDKVYNLGATHFVTKPTSFEKLKNIITKVISMPLHQQPRQTDREKFILSV